MKKSSLVDKLQKAANANVETAENTGRKTRKAVETEVQTETVLRTETDIKGNPVYQLLNSSDTLDNAEIVEKLGVMLARDPSLGKQENMIKVSQFAEVNRYYQDQMVSLAQKLAEFSHDDALSLYDDTVESIKGRLVSFKSDIEPLVHALQVIKAAEDAGENPQAVIEKVQEMHKQKAELERQIEELSSQQMHNDSEISELSERSRSLQRTITQNEERKRQEGLRIEDAQGQIDLKKGKIFGSLRFGSDISDLKSGIEDSKARVRWFENDIGSDTRSLTGLAEQLSGKETMQAEMLEKRSVYDQSLSSINQSLEGNADYQAISKLLEITGKEYKGKRENLVVNAQKFIEEAISQFNNCIERFSGLEGEIGTFSHAAKNIVGLQFLMISGAEKAYKITQGQIDLDAIAESKLAEEEKDLEFNSSAHEKLINDVKDGKEYLNAFLPTRDSVVGFRQIIASREAEFTSLSGLVQGKRLDAEELRTNGAVAVASQLVMTLKSLEAAVAGQKTDVLRSMLSEFSASARQATDQVLGGLVSDQKGRNERLDQAITDLVEMRTKIDDFSTDLLSERVTSAGLTEAIITATDRVVEATGNLANTVADGRRDAKSQIGKDEAAAIVDSYEAGIQEKKLSGMAPK